ncbi:protein kinase, partial [Klebsiella pneumoniae]|nr:protein kinase [Klebsiella pneumoniae]
MNNTRYVVPGYHLEQVLSSGANGVVFLASSILRPQVALKIWTKLRSGDKRDKQKQALYEAQKACEVEIDCRHFGIRIYDGGPISNGFYMAMEFFPGVTLNSWLTSEVQSLAVRWALANQLVEILHRIASLGILHGDMHTKNILV